MDEPFGALDAQLRLVMHDELLKLWTGTRKTIVFVTHDLAEALTLADRVAVFSARPGRIRAVETVDLPRPRDVFRIRFDPHFGELRPGRPRSIDDEQIAALLKRTLSRRPAQSTPDPPFPFLLFC